MMKKRILCLAMALMMMVGTFSTVQAKELVGKYHWKVSFDGSQMTTNFGKDQMNDELSNIQPGDSMTLKVKIENKNSQYTDWYMTNEIIKTLEDGSKATNGAYEYRLAYVDSQNNETLIYDSSTVGGDSSQGLKEIKGLDDYFYLGRLAKNDVGYVTLTLSVDGETQGNSYQATMAQLEMNFAVENVSNPAVTVNKIEHKNVYSTVKTGDSTNILWYCALGLVSGLLLIILAIFFKKKSKDEKKGE